MGRPSGVCQDTGSPVAATARALSASQLMMLRALLNMVPSASIVTCMPTLSAGQPVAPTPAWAIVVSRLNPARCSEKLKMQDMSIHKS